MIKACKTPFVAVSVPDILKEVVASMKIDGIHYIRFDLGKNNNIVANLIELDNSRGMKGMKYPLIASSMPKVFRSTDGYYGLVKIERIVIATIADANKKVLDRYAVGGTFKSILYPCYFEFFKQLSFSSHVVTQDPYAFKHLANEVPAIVPISNNLSDFVDIIEILNLEFLINQFKTC